MRPRREPSRLWSPRSGSAARASIGAWCARARRSGSSSPTRAAESRPKEIAEARWMASRALSSGGSTAAATHATSGSRSTSARQVSAAAAEAWTRRRSSRAIRSAASTVEEPHDPLLRLAGREPRPGRPLAPRDEPLAPEQVEARVVLRIPSRRRLQRLVRRHVDAGLPDIRDDALELASRPVVGHRLAEPLQLVRREVPHPGPSRERVGVQLEVALAQSGRDVRLVRRLIRAEPDVAVGPEDPPLAPFGFELGQQLLHRAEHLGLVGELMTLPVRLRVVGPQPLEELQRLRPPTAERHPRITSRAERPPAVGPSLA